MTTKTFKLYSVIAVPFPFTDSKDFKKRPALVISTEKEQRATNHVTLMMITSAKHSKWDNDYFISDLEAAGLQSSSYIRCKIFTLDLRLVIKQVGLLTMKDQQQIQALLKKHLKL